ncbi:hypothetical protein [Fibrisoma limi]|nr:hypothetical protein [Fibrisoma limi]
MTPQTPIQERITAEVNNVGADLYPYIPEHNLADPLERHLAAFVVMAGTLKPTPYKLVRLAREWSNRFYERFIDPQMILHHEDRVWITNRLAFSMMELTGRNTGLVHDLAFTWARVLANASLDALVNQGFSCTV